MAAGRATAAKAVRSLTAARDAEPSDGELLERFGRGDEAAFAAVVRRHTGMVLGVCRRALSTVQDAEDACQATFLLLARKAGTGKWQASVANWLYTTARRVAARAHRTARRRAAREAVAKTASRSPDDEPALDRMTGREAFAALDDELDRLTPVYREVLVLCHLDGLTRDEAAHRLRVPVATVKSRLERGRKKLADALAKRGIGLGAALLAVSATSTAYSSAGASPPSLLGSILAGVRGSPPDAVAELAREVAVSSWKSTGLLAVAAVAVMGFGLTTMTAATPGEQPKPAMKAEKPGAKAEPKKPEATERTVTGKVVDPDGKATSAELLLLWNRGWVDGWNWSTGKTVSLGRTNADGSFKVTVPLAERGVHLIAKAAGFGFAFATVTATSPADVTLKLVKDVPVTGRVVDGAGKPIAGATVRLEAVQTFDSDSAQAFLDSLPKRTYFREHPVGPKEWCWHPADGPFQAKTDKDGKFEIAGVGAERLAAFEVKAAGREDAELHVITRKGLDVKPLNAATLALQPKTGEKLTWGFNPILHPAEVTAVLAAEKPVRGRVTDAKTGKPRAGVLVLSGSDNGVTRTTHRATTDADGRYELHGMMKLPTYTVNVMDDLDAGYLSARTVVTDTVGHEPVVADIACQKGVLVTGTVRDKSTGKPVPKPRISAHVLAGNSFAKEFPTLGKYATLRDGTSKSDGTYRILVIPGPVLLTGGDGEFGLDTKFAPAKADPAYPDVFTTKGLFEERLSFFGLGGGQGGVDGNWCKVLNAKDTETEFKLDMELEPVTKKLVKVVDADGKPVRNARASGFTHMPWHYAESVGDTDAIPVFDLLPKEKRLVVARQPERKLVGAAEIADTDEAPVIKLGAGGTATGRVVDANGKPVAGVTVKLYFDRREVAEIYGGLSQNRKVETGPDGTFAFDELLPGYDFRFTFNVGRKQFGPEYRQRPAFKVGKHGDEVKVGDLKLGEPQANE